VRAFLGYITWRFSIIGQPNNPPELQIWSHRGVHDSLPENTIEAFQLAKNQHFKGIELDVYFDDSVGFVVSHDFPYQLVEGKLLTLNEVVDTFQSDFFYWMDLKNLDKKNRRAISKEFQKLFLKYPSLQEKIFVESANGWALRQLAKKGVQSIYWVQFSRNQPKQYFKIWYLKTIITGSNFSGITSDYRYLLPPFERIFGHLNWFVFTVNDTETINYLKTVPAVKVILTDLEGNEVLD
jgi:glycerophosphoryl diester phosphodiesterase